MSCGNCGKCRVWWVVPSSACREWHVPLLFHVKICDLKLEIITMHSLESKVFPIHFTLWIYTYMSRLLKEFVTSSWPVQQLKRALVQPYSTKDQTLQKPDLDPICQVFDLTYENQVKIMWNMCIIRVCVCDICRCMHMCPTNCKAW